MRRHSLRTILITIFLTSAATIAALRWDFLPGYGEEETYTPAFAADPLRQPALTSDEEINVRVYEEVSPGVVHVTKKVVGYDFYFYPVCFKVNGIIIWFDNFSIV